MPSPKTIYTSQPFQDASGNVIPNGLLVLDLSAPAVATGGGQVAAPLRVQFALNASGMIPNDGTHFLWTNDQLNPSNTYYTARVFNSNNLLVDGPIIWIITGPTPIDVSQIASSLPAVFSPNAVLQNPTGAQSITGFPLSLTNSAPLNVQSALSANRIIFDQGTSVSVADFTLTGWGSGASIGLFSGTDSCCQFTVTAGMSPSVGPTVTLTYHDGTWNVAPLVMAQMVGGTGAITDVPTLASPTSVILTYDGLPISTQTYVFTVLSFGVVPILFSQPPPSFANASTIVAQTTITGVSASITTTALYSGNAGMYRLQTSLIATATGTGNANAVISYNNGSGSPTILGKTVGFGVLGSEAADVFDFYSAASQNINFATSYAATGTYSLRLRLEYLG